MDTIKVTSSCTVCDGRDAVEVFRLAALISALRLEIKGIRMSRGASMLAIAKRTTGLRTNDRTTQAARLRVMLEEARSRVHYADERTQSESQEGPKA